MLKQITKEEVNVFLDKSFPQYKITEDPFEAYLGYYENKLVGLIAYSIIYERAEINYICVEMSYRGKKIGSKLLEKALEIMKDSNCNVVSLEVNKYNENAINLYMKYGFEIKAIRKKYYNGEDGLLLTKRLGDENE